MIGTKSGDVMTAAGGSGTLIPEDLLSNDSNYDDRDSLILWEADEVIRSEERRAGLVHGIGDLSVRPLGLSTEHGAQMRRMPPVLGHVATIQFAPYKYGRHTTGPT